MVVAPWGSYGPRQPIIQARPGSGGSHTGHKGRNGSPCRRRAPDGGPPTPHWAPNEPRRGSRGGGPCSVRLLQARYVSFRRQRTCASSSVGRQCAIKRHMHRSKQRHYSITSSVRAKQRDGRVEASALAVLRFITVSNLVACWLGRSPGFSPLRMRSNRQAHCNGGLEKLVPR